MGLCVCTYGCVSAHFPTVSHFVPITTVTSCPLPLQYKTSWLMFTVTVKIFSNVLMKGTVGIESTYLILTVFWMWRGQERDWRGDLK